MTKLSYQKSGLVLSLFPGAGLLDKAFEAVGFCVVRGPDLIFGGDIRQFRRAFMTIVVDAHPAYRFLDRDIMLEIQHVLERRSTAAYLEELLMAEIPGYAFKVVILPGRR